MRIQGIAGEPRKIGTRPLLRESNLPFQGRRLQGQSEHTVRAAARLGDRQRREELQHQRQTTQ